MIKPVKSKSGVAPRANARSRSRVLSDGMFNSTQHLQCTAITLYNRKTCLNTAVEAETSRIITECHVPPIRVPTCLFASYHTTTFSNHLQTLCNHRLATCEPGSHVRHFRVVVVALLHGRTPATTLP